MEAGDNTIIICGGPLADTKTSLRPSELVTARSREILPWMKVWNERLTPCQYLYKIQWLLSKTSTKLRFGGTFFFVVSIHSYPSDVVLCLKKKRHGTATHVFSFPLFFHWTPKLLGNFGASRGAQAPPTKKAFIGKGIGTSVFIQIPLL